MADKDDRPGHLLEIPDSVAHDLDSGRDVPIEALLSPDVVEAAQTAQAEHLAPVHAESLQPITAAEAASRTTFDGEHLPAMPRMARVIPEPYKRPCIDFDGRHHGRSWTWCFPGQVTAGDTVPGVGLVTDVGSTIQYAARSEVLGSAVLLTPDHQPATDPDTQVAVGEEVILTGPDGTKHRFDPKKQVQAFRLRQDT